MAVTQNLPLQKYVSFKGEIQYKVNKLLIHKTLRDNCASSIWLKFDKNSSSQGLGYIAVNFWWRMQKTGLKNELLGNSKTVLEDPQGRDRSGASVVSRDRGSCSQKGFQRMKKLSKVGINSADHRWVLLASQFQGPQNPKMAPTGNGLNLRQAYW